MVKSEERGTKAMHGNMRLTRGRSFSFLLKSQREKENFLQRITNLMTGFEILFCFAIFSIQITFERYLKWKLFSRFSVWVTFGALIFLICLFKFLHKKKS
jgi:hypothetical protein